MMKKIKRIPLNMAGIIAVLLLLGVSQSFCADVPAADNAYIQVNRSPRDSSQELLTKSNRRAYLRFNLSGANEIGDIAAAAISSASLNLHILGHDDNDILDVYVLQDAAAYSPTNLTETSWTGGSDGTTNGIPPNNVDHINAPDGGIPSSDINNAPEANSLLTLVGSFTYPPGGDDLLVNQVIQVPLSSLVDFKAAIAGDSNGEITLILDAQNINGSSATAVSSLFNTNSLAVPTLSIETGPDTTAPAAPAGLTVVTERDGIVDLEWDFVLDADVEGYKVYRSTTSASYGAALATITNIFETTYQDTTVVNGSTYYYVVTASDEVPNESTNSLEVVANPILDVTAPAVPANLTASAGDGAVPLNWDDVADLDLASYNVYRSTISGGPYGAALANVTGSAYTDSAVDNGTTYYYVVTAVDDSSSANESAQSAQASATPIAIIGGGDVITFGSANDGLGGFTQSTPVAGQTWSTEAGSVRVSNTDAGTVNSSFLGSYSLDPTNGNSYTFEGVVEMTDGYADDNNRVGFYLFGDADEIPNEDETGALGLIFNTDDANGPGIGPDDNLQLREGIDTTPIHADVDRNEAGTVAWAQDLFGTEITFKADIVYTNVAGTDLVNITASMTDENLAVTALPEVSLVASNYTGSYFGFVTRSRSRNYPDTAANQGAPWVMSYKSFTFTDNNALVGYAGWAEAFGGTNVIGGADDDYDNDGADNITEYGLDGDPTNSLVQGSALPVFSKSGSDFIYVHPKRKDDTSLTYTVQTTGNLGFAAWTNTGYTVGDTYVPPTGTFDFVSNNVDTVADEKFIRLKITQ